MPSTARKNPWTRCREAYEEQKDQEIEKLEQTISSQEKIISDGLIIRS